jgi:hypothetical protein
MHVSSTCGADRMESLKEWKAGPGGGTHPQRGRLMQGIGSRASRAQREQVAAAQLSSRVRDMDRKVCGSTRDARGRTCGMDDHSSYTGVSDRVSDFECPGGIA